MIDEMVKTIEKPGKDFLDQQYQESNIELKKRAKEYFELYEKIDNQLKNIKEKLQQEEAALKAVKNGSIQASQVYKNSIQKRRALQSDYRKEIVSKSLQFQNFLNELLNQIVELIYVYEDEQGNPSLTTIKSDDLPNILHYENSHGLASGRFREKYNDFVLHLEKLKDVEISDDFNLDFFNYTYKEVIWRYNYSKSQLVLWLLNPGDPNSRRWGKAKVVAQGDIKEAYASVILDRSINSVKTFNADFLDTNVQSFMEEVEKVDSESGLLKGDVVVGNVHYAIKGSDASTLGIKQIYTLAQEIVKKDNYTTKDLIQKKEQFHKKASTRNHIQVLTSKKINKNLRSLQDRIRALNQMSMNSLIQINFNEMHPKDFT